jgi:uroporphyrinogen decarboxylase
MNDKENALRIIHFDHPERAMTGCPTHVVAYRGANHEGYTGGGHHLPVGSRWTDIWGTGWHKEHAGVMGFPREHPLADLPRALRSYQWPDPDDERICGWVYEQANAFRCAEGWEKPETFLCGSHRDTLWEKSYMLVGMQDLMCFFFTEPQAVRDLLHRIMDFQLGMARHYLAIGVEMVGMGDDLGTQKGLLLSPQVIDEFLVPEYRRLFDLYKKHGVLVNFHSCGHVTPMLETFMELGVDILNPVQATANDLDEMRRVTLPHSNGRGMALQGGVRSSTIYSGPIEAIRAEVAERLWQLGREGGYFCGPDQGMPWPAEHIQALHDAVGEFGRYPLEPSEQSGLVDRATL